MKNVNIEIKAKSNRNDKIREILKANNADFKGVDHQVDTYFETPNGRLKLREGNIENYLIHYNRSNQTGPKQSDVTLAPLKETGDLKELLSNALGVKVVVDKKREISFIDNIKFHLDTVEGLGTFVEIEAIDKDGNIGIEKLTEQCNKYLNDFGIEESDLIAVSYSDLLLNSTD